MKRKINKHQPGENRLTEKILPVQHKDSPVKASCEDRFHQEPASQALVPVTAELISQVPITVSSAVSVSGNSFDPDVYAAVATDALLSIIENIPPDRWNALEEIAIEPQFLVQALPPNIRLKLNHNRQPE